MIQLLFFLEQHLFAKRIKSPHPRRAGATSLPSESLKENFPSALT